MKIVKDKITSIRINSEVLMRLKERGISAQNIIDLYVKNFLKRYQGEKK